MTVVQLGAPGIYQVPAVSAPPPDQPVRLDVAGIVGIAPRGPVNEPLAVRSWAEYVHRFGEPGGSPGRLGDAVATFFRQGGARAYVVRVAPPVADDTAVAVLVFAGGKVRLAARDEGSWGNSLTARIDHVVTGRFPITRVAADRITPPAGLGVPVGSLLRIVPLRRPGEEDPPFLCWVVDRTTESGTRQTVLTLDRPVPPGSAEVVTASVTVTAAGVQERHDGLGLSPAHPRWTGTVLADKSLLVRPHGPWDDRIEPATPDLSPAVTVIDHPGRDRYDEITGSSFLDGYPAPNDPGETRPGVDALDPVIGELGLIVVPDLLHATPTAAPAPERTDPPHDFRPRFRPCTPPEPETPPAPAPTPPAVLDDDTEILARQRGLVARTGPDRPAIVLLDVPPHLRGTRILAWRASFGSDRVAAYHPWLRTVRPDGTTVVAPPSPFAAGIIAARERRAGVATGPANELAADAIGVTDVLTDEQHGLLHRAGINVFRPERDGVRLLGARTLSADPAYRQLSVRRLMTWIRLSVARRLESALFEANTPALRTSLRLQVTTMLSGLFRAGALNGGSEAEAFFVHCDETLNTPETVEQGRLFIEVGVNPSEPIEYLLLRFALAANGSVTADEVAR
ncbi:phage tail sheath C-terminal domain-containing protein [Actinoplanes sp. HUAS TT8]|uniref:phage tail sheath family protein n=1 Tax=Actinoplanes sp. HUAS TT8 TaxID=3447453 RepID=UPI003F527FDF